jgi:hypothetical protein
LLLNTKKEIGLAGNDATGTVSNAQNRSYYKEYLQANTPKWVDQYSTNTFL